MVIGANARDRALDIAKGVAIGMVLYMHLMPVAFLPGSVFGVPGQLASLAVNAPYRWLLKAAVPAFYLVSSIIYLRRWSHASPFLWRRLKATGLVLGVWILIEYAWLGIAARGLPSVRLKELLVGGPAPFGLYFLLDLLLLYLVMEVVCRFRAAVGDPAATRVSVWVVGGFGLALFALPFLGVSSVPYWSLWPFVVYPFLAIVVESRSIRDRRLGAICGALFILGIGADIAWRTAGLDVNGLGYARLPAMAGSVLVLFLAKVLDDKGLRGSDGLAVLGRHSLGLFVVHPLAILLLVNTVPIRTFTLAGGVLTLRLLQAGAGFALTLGTVLLLARTPLRMLVTSGSAVRR